MATWSDLPPDLKRDILARTDPRVRHSCRLLSKKDKEDFDACMFHVTDADINWLDKQTPKKALAMMRHPSFARALENNPRYMVEQSNSGRKGLKVNVRLMEKDRECLPEENEQAPQLPSDVYGRFCPKDKFELFGVSDHTYRKLKRDEQMGNVHIWDQTCPQRNKVDCGGYKVIYDPRPCRETLQEAEEEQNYMVAQQARDPFYFDRQDNTETIRDNYKWIDKVDPCRTNSFYLRQDSEWPDEPKESAALSEARRMLRNKPARQAKGKRRCKGKRPANRWAMAVKQARQHLGVTGFVPVKRGSALYKEAKRRM